MNYSDDENYPVKRPTFLTVLCILTYVGSGWALFSAVTAYNTAETTVSMFSDSIIYNGNVVKAQKDTLVISSIPDTVLTDEAFSSDSLLMNDTLKAPEINSNEESDSASARIQIEKSFEERIKTNVLDMMSVEKMKNSAIGSFIAALFTLAGAFFMWRLRKYGFYLYIIGIAIGIIIPFYIFGNNLLAIGISAFSSFFGLVFIAMYALNLKSMK